MNTPKLQSEPPQGPWTQNYPVPTRSEASSFPTACCKNSQKIFIAPKLARSFEISGNAHKPEEALAKAAADLFSLIFLIGRRSGKRSHSPQAGLRMAPENDQKMMLMSGAAPALR
jgi:hypothetical protein